MCNWCKCVILSQFQWYELINLIIILQDVVNGTNGGIEKGDSEKNGGGEKWRNSYVPYEEEYNNQWNLMLIKTLIDYMQYQLITYLYRTPLV